MKRRTLAGIGLSVATFLLPLCATFERPAVAQFIPPPDSPDREFMKRATEEAVLLARSRMAKAEDEYRENQAMAADLEAKLRALTGRADTSRASLAKAANRMDEEAESLALEQAGADARQQALEATIAEQAKRAEIAVEGDVVAAELQKVVDARASQLKRRQQLHAAGNVTDADVGGAEAALAEARARLAERRQQTATTGGGGALAEWSRELLNLSIANAERRAKLKFLEDRRQHLADALQQGEGLSRYKDAMARADQNRRAAANEFENAQETIRRLRPAPTTAPGGT